MPAPFAIKVDGVMVISFPTLPTAGVTEAKLRIGIAALIVMTKSAAADVPAEFTAVIA